MSTFALRMAAQNENRHQAHSVQDVFCCLEKIRENRKKKAADMDHSIMSAVRHAPVSGEMLGKTANFGRRKRVDVPFLASAHGGTDFFKG